MSSILKIFSYACLIWVTTSAEIFSLTPNTLARFRAYVWNGINYSRLNALTNDDGKKTHVNAHFFKNQFYFIYGVYHDINLWLNFDFLVTTATEDTDIGLGDGGMGAKFRIIKQSSIPFAAALETSVRFPLSDYDTNKVTAFGTGQTDFVLGLILGHELSAFPMNFALGGGYLFRFQEAPDQFYIVFDISLQILASFEIKLKSYFYYSFRGLEYGGGGI